VAASEKQKATCRNQVCSTESAPSTCWEAERKELWPCQRLRSGRDKPHEDGKGFTGS